MPQDFLAASGAQRFNPAFCFTASVDPASIAGATSSNTTVTVPGGAELLSTDQIVAIPPATLENGLGCVGAYYASATTLTLRLVNATAGAIDGAAKTWTFMVFRQ